MGTRLIEQLGTRVVAFGAHPDDLEIGAGGTIARLIAEGAEVTMVTVSVPTLLEQRLEEAARSAKVLGAPSRILFPKLCRAEDIPMYELVRAMDTVLNDIRPDLVLTHSATDLHWDHGLVNRAAISAMRRLPSNLFAYTSSYELNAGSRGIGQCFIDIGATLSTKLMAVAAHQTQLPKIDIEGIRDLSRAMGRIAGIEHAEAFEVLRMRL